MDSIKADIDIVIHNHWNGSREIQHYEREVSAPILMDSHIAKAWIEDVFIKDMKHYGDLALVEIIRAEFPPRIIAVFTLLHSTYKGENNESSN